MKAYFFTFIQWSKMIVTPVVNITLDIAFCKVSTDITNFERLMDIKSKSQYHQQCIQSTITSCSLSMVVIKILSFLMIFFWRIYWCRLVNLFLGCPWFICCKLGDIIGNFRYTYFTCGTNHPTVISWFKSEGNRGQHYKWSVLQSMTSLQQHLMNSVSEKAKS